MQSIFIIAPSMAIYMMGRTLFFSPDVALSRGEARRFEQYRDGIQYRMHNESMDYKDLKTQTPKLD